MEQISRTLAKERGMTYYYTGAPCVQGHVSKRFVSSGGCYTCVGIRRNDWRCRNQEQAKQALEQWRSQNKDAVRAGHRRSYRRNIENRRNYCRQNAHKRAAAQRSRESLKRSATPSWLSQTDLKKIEAHYLFSRLRFYLTGVKHEVDHIVPLRGEFVCGLHVPWNLQVIPALDNRKKYNKHS